MALKLALWEASFISGRGSATHPCIHCDSISDLCSWSIKAECPCDLSAILCIKHQPVVYIGNSWNGVGTEDVIYVWEGGRGGGYMFMIVIEILTMSCICYNVLPNSPLSPLPAYVARIVRLKLWKQTKNLRIPQDIFISLYPLSTLHSLTNSQHSPRP